MAALAGRKLRYREYEKAVGEGKNTVTIPVAEIHPPKAGASIRGPQKMVRPSAAASALFDKAGLTGPPDLLEISTSSTGVVAC